MPTDHLAWYANISGGLTPERAQQLARASSEEKNAAVRDLIQRTSSATAVTALQPVPVLDAAILTPVQHRLVHSIGLIRGRDLADEQVKRMFRAFRRPIVASQSMLAAVKLFQWVPWVPEIFAASLAYALTFAIGQVTDECLARPMRADELRSRLEEISRERFAVTFRTKRDELRALFRDPETRRQVRAIATARREGKMEENEVLRRMETILGSAGSRRRPQDRSPSAT